MTENDFLLLLPTLNEEEAMEALGKEIPSWMDVLVVDGGSTDGTMAVAERLGYTFLPQKFGNGKGCGVRTGMEYFLEKGYKYMGMIDTDYTNVPGEMETLLGVLKSNGYDLVMGYRDRRVQLKLLGPLSVFINWSTSSLVSFSYRMWLPDIQTSFWLFSRKSIDALYPMLEASGFDIEYDMVYNSWRKRLKVGAAPVTFRKRLGSTKFTNGLRFKQIRLGLGYVKKSLAIMLFGEK